MTQANSVEAILKELYELARQSRWREVADVAQRAVKEHPREPMLILRWAQGLRQLNQIEQAVQLSQRAIQMQPDLAEAHICQADLLGIQGKWAKAVEGYQTAIRLWPNNADLCQRLGDAAMRAGQVPLAHAAFQQELALRPSARAWIDLGTILETQNQWPGAEECFQRAAQLEPGNAAPWHRLGVCFGKQGNLDRAIELIQHGLQIDARDGNIWHDLGIAFAKAGRPAEAAAACEQVVARQPKRLEDFYGWALNLRDSGQYDKALEILDRALALDPEDPDSRGLRGVIWLVQGDLARGWAEYEWRKRTKSFPTPMPKFGTPEWRGEEDIAGKTILLHAEQGMGDTIQFIRYAPILARRGVKVIVAAPGELARLVERVDGVSGVVSPGGTLPAFDVHCSLLSLPLAMGTTEATIPVEIPYIYLEPEWVETWRERLGDSQGRLRVGLAWAGSPAHRNDRNRSCRLETLRPIIEAGRAAGVDFFSLQKGEPIKNHPSGIVLTDWMGEVRDFADTAGLISQLDLVIAVDTSVVHLAGAMGKPVWVLLPQVPDWRWMLERGDTPWYPTMRLFRKVEKDDWGVPVEQVRAALAAMCEGRG